MSRLDSRGYRIVAGGGILKVIHGDRFILEKKKRIRGHYYLVGTQCKVKLQKSGGVQSEVELQEEGVEHEMWDLRG